MSAFNPFRANPLSPSSTGASVNTVTSYNPPPSFHSVARDDETTVYFDDVDELPVISEAANEGTEFDEGSDLSRSGTVSTTTGTGRGSEGTETPRRGQTPLIDLDRSLPSTPRLSPTTPTTTRSNIQVEEPPLQALSLSPRNTGSGTTTEDVPAPRYPDDLPPAYTPAPDLNHGEATLEVGPRRPFQQPPRQPRAPTTLMPPPGDYSPSYLSPTPTAAFPSRNTSSLNRGRYAGRWAVLQQWTDSVMEQLDQVANTTGVGNLRSPSDSGPTTTTTTGVTSNLNNRPTQQAPRHTRSLSDFGSRTGGRSPVPATFPAPVAPPLPPRLSPNPTGGSARSVDSVDTINTRRSAPAATTTTTTTTTTNSNTTPSIPSTATSDFAQDFYAAGTGEGLINVDPPSSDEDDNVPLGLRRAEEPRSRSFEGLGTAMPNEAGRSTDDDRPTTQPVPGRVLLNGNKILIYPKGFTCPRCFNIGYKRSDPSHPCKKCWKKYSKVYSPIMSYAPDSNSTTTPQRPLPKPTVPTSNLGVPGGTAPPNPNSPNTRPNTLRRPPSQPGLHRPTPSLSNLNAACSNCGTNTRTMPGGYPSSTGCAHPFHSRSPPPSSPVISTARTAPYLAPQRTGGPGVAAAVYSAGDPRLGGRRCWSCGGTGRISYFLFDNSNCLECSGIGRVYP